ncbi:restriction endonuclease [bacterium]|nr:MAG: restriction endonuclease [bacterium]
MSEEYKKEIRDLITSIPENTIILPQQIERGGEPTQAFSDFITHREQGDWAEDVIFRAIKEIENGIVAVRYGRSEKIVAGEPGFSEFYEAYRKELTEIGKRPDLLIFRKEDFGEFNEYDISRYDIETLTNIVPKAIAGLEIRSSSFLVEKYNEYSNTRRMEIIGNIKTCLETLKSDYENLPDRWQQWLDSVNPDDLETLFNVPRFTKKVEVHRDTISSMKAGIGKLKKRDYLSFTPKVEDIFVINTWIQTYGVPHYYVQVFFDKSYAISFKNILEIISDETKKGERFTIERNSKNQFKSTIYLDVGEGSLLAEKIDMPKHKSICKEFERGRLLFYITFEEGNAYLDVDAFLSMIGAS